MRTVLLCILHSIKTQALFTGTLELTARHCLHCLHSAQCIKSSFSALTPASVKHKQEGAHSLHQHYLWLPRHFRRIKDFKSSRRWNTSIRSLTWFWAVWGHLWKAFISLEASSLRLYVVFGIYFSYWIDFFCYTCYNHAFSMWSTM